jgi:hypothetical protein
MIAAIIECIDSIEECYEFMLRYAAQGLATDEGSQAGRQLRELLENATEALRELSDICVTAIGDGSLEQEDPLLPFLSVLDRDARYSLAVMELVLAQPVISSQLIDNLNASSHVRTLLTDLFLIAEIASLERSAPHPVGI